MTGILLGILKITGIILLVIAALFILGVCLIVLIPIRYKINFKYKDNMDLYICVSWLLHFVHAEYRIGSGAAVKICGVKLFGNKKSPKKNSIESQKRKPEEQPAESNEADKNASEAEASDKDKAAIEISAEEAVLKKIPDKSITQKEIEKAAEKPYKKNNRKIFKFSPGAVYQKIKLKAVKSHKRLKQSFIRLCSSVKNFEKKINDKSLHRALKKLLNEGFKAAAHCLPQQISGYIKFGFGEPYATGTVLSYAAFCLPLYRYKFEVIPAFEENIIETDTEAIGKIRIGVLLIAILKLYLNKDVRKWIKRFL